MRRLPISVLAALLLVGMVAAPAAADRDLDSGSFPHDISWINPFFDGPEAEVATGEWVGVFTGWGTLTPEQLDDFKAAATVELICDGKARDVHQWNLVPTVEVFDALVPPMPAGRTTECASVITFTADHYDGWDWYYEGTVLTDTVTITAVPRGQFMKSNP